MAVYSSYNDVGGNSSSSGLGWMGGDGDDDVKKAGDDEFKFDENDKSIARDIRDLEKYATKKGVLKPELEFTQKVGAPYPAPARGPEGSALPQSGKAADWVARNITTLSIPQLQGRRYVKAYDEYGKDTHLTSEYDVWQRAMAKKNLGTTVQFNTRAVNQLKALWNEWERRDLLKLVIFEIGFWVPRYKRNSAGGTSTISNHAYGTAFDINSDTNGYRKTPASRNQWGNVLPLVPIAIDYGFYWGGFYRDGMHFEVAKIIP